MKNRKKTILNILLILFILSFFVTPMGYYGKLILNRVFSFSPPIIEKNERVKIPDYDWKLKDAEWNFFSFEKSKGRVVFINFWASWRLPSEAELSSIQKLYDKYKGKIDFYVITNEERQPVEEFIEKNDISFPITYLIIGERAPFEVMTPPASYLIDRNGYIVVNKEGISKWHSSKMTKLIDELIAE